MENDDAGTDRSTQTAQTLLHDLAGDRVVLAGRLRSPRWLYPAAGLLMAIFVASPAVSNDGLRGTITFATALGFLALGLAHQRITGVRLGMGGPIAFVVVALTVFTGLFLLSASYGLALVSPWWVIPPAVLAFAAVGFLGRWLERMQVGEVRRGR